MRFEKGICVDKLHETGKILKKNTGTKIVTKPDETIWSNFDDFDISAIKKRMKQLAYLNPGLTIKLKIDYLDYDINETYSFENGLDEYIKELLGEDEPLTSVYRINKSVPIDEDGKTIDLDIAFAYTEKNYDNILAFTNNVANTNKKSSHITGFKAGLASAIKDALNDSDLNKSKLEITNEDTREGVVSVISIKLFNPFYEGQGKDILNMPIVRSVISNAIEEFVLDQFDKNPNEKNIILSKVIDAARVREAVRKTKEATRKVKGLSGGKVPGLTKAGSNDPSEREIFLVEGDSAAGSAKKARNEYTDAILPVFGKINNTFGMTLDKLLKSPKMMNTIKALGCGIGEDFDLEKLQYNKIIILTDGDVDGLHIRCLWLTFFFRNMKQLIENGHVYIALPPLFTIVTNPRTKKEKTLYAYTIEEKDAIIKTLKCKYEVNREKGLGEMNWEELKESTMDVETRKLIKVKIEDEEECLRILDICMNDKSIKSRKEFILNKGEKECQKKS